ncbi:MAG: phosphatidate cytidylyltransferase [Chloroflexota bacterium]
MMQTQHNISPPVISAPNWADFPTRVITALIGGPIVLLAVIAGSPFFDLLIFALGILAATEVVNVMNSRHGITKVVTFLMVPGVMLVVAYATAYLYLLPLVLLVPALIMSLVARFAGDGRSEAWLRNGLYPVLGALYVALPLGLLILIRAGENGLLCISAVMWSIWFTDTFALIGGRLIGRHKLAPRISPGKTIEGALVGILAGMSIGMVIMIFGGRPVYMAVSLAVTVAGMAVAGDLLESWLKRYFRVKDSGSILPGHGGILDRIDGFIGAVPVYYLLVLVFAML